MSDHAMMIPADATAIGMTTALRRGYNGRKPRTRYSNALKREGTSSNVRVMFADGTEEIRSAYSFRTKSPNRRNRTAPAINYNTGRYVPMAADMAPIGNIE